MNTCKILEIPVQKLHLSDDDKTKENREQTWLCRVSWAEISGGTHLSSVQQVIWIQFFIHFCFTKV